MPQAFLEGHIRLEAELLARAVNVELASRLAVGLGRVPNDLAFESGELRDQRHQVADGDLAARAEVHRLGLVVALGGEDDRPRRVIDVEELARRGPGTPDGDRPRMRVARLNALADERGDHV